MLSQDTETEMLVQVVLIAISRNELIRFIVDVLSMTLPC